MEEGEPLGASVGELLTMHLALFDFDGTITRRDSFFDFLLYTYGAARCALGLVLLGPMMARYLLKLVPNWKAKEAVFRYFLRGMTVEGLERAGDRYSRERLDAIIRNEARERIAWHRERGHRIIVVSASVDVWMREWCGRYGMDIIGTRLESERGRLTGRILGANCQGAEKARRIREALNPEDFEHIYAYGNSRGDAEMLSLAHERYYNWVRVV